MRLFKLFLILTANIYDKSTSIKKAIKIYRRHFFDTRDVVIFFCPIYYFIFFIYLNTNPFSQLMNLFALIGFALLLFLNILNRDYLDKVISDFLCVFLTFIFIHFGQPLALPILSLNLSYPFDQNLPRKMYILYMDFESEDGSNSKKESSSNKTKIKRNISFKEFKNSRLVRAAPKMGAVFGIGYLVYKTNTDWSVIESIVKPLELECDRLSDLCAISDSGSDIFKENQLKLIEKKAEARILNNELEVWKGLKQIKDFQLKNIPDFGQNREGLIPKNLQVKHSHSLNIWRK